MNSRRQSSTSLPPHFQEAIRTLFDILDTDRSGFIRFRDLANRWNDQKPNGELPPGYLECLRKVTPPNGMLTFERFCAGLKLALAEVKSNKDNQQDYQDIPYYRPARQPLRPQPSLGVNSYNKQNIMNDNSHVPPPIDLAAPKPNKPLNNMNSSANYANYNTNSNYVNSNYEMDTISRDTYANIETIQWYQNKFEEAYKKKRSTGLSRGTRTAPTLTAQLQASRPAAPPPSYHQVLISRAKNNTNTSSSTHSSHSSCSASPPQTMSNGVYRRSVPPPPCPGSTNHSMPDPRRIPDAPKIDLLNQPIRNRPASTLSSHATSSSGIGTSSNSTSPNNSPPQNFANSTTALNGLDLSGVRFRDKSKLTQVYDKRRHTMTEGVEARTAKHDRLLEEEKELLERGSNTATRLANWYNQRLHSLETRLRIIRKGMVPLDYGVQEEKINYLRAHVTELNRRMVALMETSDKGFPSHINLEVSRSIPQPSDDQILWLKKQNKTLTEELTDKQSLMHQLEEEKASLIRQVFQQQAELSAQKASPSLPSLLHAPSKPQRSFMNNNNNKYVPPTRNDRAFNQAPLLNRTASQGDVSFHATLM